MNRISDDRWRGYRAGKQFPPKITNPRPTRVIAILMSGMIVVSLCFLVLASSVNNGQLWYSLSFKIAGAIEMQMEMSKTSTNQ